MSKGRSGHGGSSLDDVKLAKRLIQEFTELVKEVEAAITLNGPLTSARQQELLTAIQTTFQQIEHLDLVGKVGAVEQEIAAGKEALHAQFVESCEIGNQIKMAHIFIGLGPLEASLAAKTQELEAKTQELADVEAKLAEYRAQIAAM